VMTTIKTTTTGDRIQKEKTGDRRCVLPFHKTTLLLETKHARQRLNLVVQGSEPCLKKTITIPKRE